MANPPALMSARRPRTWFSGLAALALAASLTGCGAIIGVQKADSSDESSPAVSDSAPATSDGGGSKIEASPSSDPSSLEPAEDSEDRESNWFQEAGNPDKPESWLLAAKLTELDGAESEEVENLVGPPDARVFSLSFSFEHPNASKECKEAVKAINDFSTPLKEMSTAKYEGNFKPHDPAGGTTTVESSAFITTDELNVMDVYDDVVTECGKTDGEPKSSMEKPFGGEGVHVRIGSDDLIIAGKSRGRHHIWMVMLNLDHEEAKKYIDAQIDLFDRTVTNAA